MTAASAAERGLTGYARDARARRETGKTRASRLATLPDQRNGRKHASDMHVDLSS